jgi:hypothetical protein
MPSTNRPTELAMCTWRQLRLPEEQSKCKQRLAAQAAPKTTDMAVVQLRTTYPVQFVFRACCLLSRLVGEALSLVAQAPQGKLHQEKEGAWLSGPLAASKKMYPMRSTKRRNCRFDLRVLTLPARYFVKVAGTK